MEKKIKARTFIVTICEKERKEMAWDSLSPEEKERSAMMRTNRFMESAGYIPAEGIA